MDTTIFDSLRHSFQLIQRGQTYLSEPQVKKGLAKEGIDYADVSYALITPMTLVPMSMPLISFEFLLQKEGFQCNPTYNATLGTAIQEAFSIDPTL